MKEAYDVSEIDPSSFAVFSFFMASPTSTTYSGWLPFGDILEMMHKEAKHNYMVLVDDKKRC